VKQYEEALKQARAKVYAEQEADRKKLLDERAGFLKEARAKASGEVNVAKESVAGELAAAKKEIEASVEATGRGDRAAGVAGAACTGQPGERGTMSRRGWTRALLAAVVLLSSSVLARAAEEGGSPAEQPIGTSSSGFTS